LCLWGTQMLLILGGVVVAAALWAWFARDLPRAVRIVVFAVAAATAAFLLFAILIDRMN